MTTLNPASPDLAALQQQLLGRFERFRRRVRTHLVLEGAARVLAEVVGIALLSFVADRVFRLGLGSRLVFLLIAAGFIARSTSPRQSTASAMLPTPPTATATRTARARRTRPCP
jgi:hypothetical protein